MKTRIQERKFVFVSDTQAPYQSDSCVALACEFIRLYRPSLLILGGDMVDFFTAQTKFRRLGEPHRFVAEEVRVALETVVKPLCKASPDAEKVWIEGNHEFRLKRYIAMYADKLEGFPGLTIQDAFHMKELGIKYVDSIDGNGVYKVTPLLTAMHGKRLGVNPSKSEYDNYGASLIMGHTHKESLHRKKWGCGRDDKAISAGCLCNPPDFMDYDNYTRGFVAGTIYEDTGEFYMGHVDISGDGFTNMYSPQFGRMRAKFVQKVGRDGHWKVERG